MSMSPNQKMQNIRTSPKIMVFAEVVFLTPSGDLVVLNPFEMTSLSFGEECL